MSPMAGSVNHRATVPRDILPFACINPWTAAWLVSVACAEKQITLAFLIKLIWVGVRASNIAVKKFGSNSKSSGRVTLATKCQVLASSRRAMGLGLVDGFQKIIGSRQDWLKTSRSSSKVSIFQLHQCISHGKYMLSKEGSIVKICKRFCSSLIQFQTSLIQNSEVPAAPHQKMYNNSIMMANFMLSIGLNGNLD
jgi:hypothetical protein